MASSQTLSAELCAASENVSCQTRVSGVKTNPWIGSVQGTLERQMPIDFSVESEGSMT